VEQPKAEGSLRRRVHLRQCKYLNNVVKQDRRAVKQRAWLAKGYGSFQSAWRTLQEIQAVNMIRKGECDGWPKATRLVKTHFFGELFEIAA
jgi:IS6 family transposase